MMSESPSATLDDQHNQPFYYCIGDGKAVKEDREALMACLRDRDDIKADTVLKKYECCLKKLLTAAHFRELATCKYEDKRIVECIFKYALYYDFADELKEKDEGVTPWQSAIKNALKNKDNQLVTVLVMLALGADPGEVKDIDYELEEIAEKADAGSTLEIIIDLLKKYEEQSKSDEHEEREGILEDLRDIFSPTYHTGRTELMKAVNDNKLELIKTVLSASDVDLAAVDDENWNVFHHLATARNQEIIKECFYDVKSELFTSEVLDAVNSDEKRPLQLAVERGRPETALGLLVLGANANFAINAAVETKDIHLAEMMIAFGADVNYVVDDKTPLDRALSSNAQSSEVIEQKLKGVGAKKFAELGCEQEGPPVKKLRRTTSSYTDRVLTLDGGGVKGLVEIMLLQAIEKAVGLPESKRNVIQNCFDWFFGTSTGGILAMAIAKGKELSECFTMYMKMKDRVFKSKPYDTKILEELLKDEFKEMEMRELKSDLKVAVTSVMLGQADSLRWFRNYESHVPRDFTDAASEIGEYKINLHFSKKHSIRGTTSIVITLVGEPSTKCELQIENEIYISRNVQTSGYCGKLLAIRSIGFFQGVGFDYLGDFLIWHAHKDEFQRKSDNTWLFMHRSLTLGVGSMKKPHLPAQYYRQCSACSTTISIEDKIAQKTHFFPISGSEVDEVDDPQNESSFSSLSKVWHAARATSAAPSYFDEFCHHVDGGLIANNPSREAIEEVEEFHHRNGTSPNGVVVSLGTGKYEVAGYRTLRVVGVMHLLKKTTECLEAVYHATDTIKHLKDLITDTESVVQPSRRRCERLLGENSFYRLQPELSADVDMDCTDNRKIVRMLYDTRKYIYDHRSEIAEIADQVRPELI